MLIVLLSVYVPILFSIYLLQEYKWVSTTEGSTTIQQTISQRDWWLLPRAGLLCSMLLFWLDYCWMDSGPEFACSSSSPDVIFPCAFFRQRIHIQWQYLFCSLDLVLGLGWFFLENVQHQCSVLAMLSSRGYQTKHLWVMTVCLLSRSFSIVRCQCVFLVSWPDKHRWVSPIYNTATHVIGQCNTVDILQPTKRKASSTSHQRVDDAKTLTMKSMMRTYFDNDEIIQSGTQKSS